MCVHVLLAGRKEGQSYNYGPVKVRLVKSTKRSGFKICHKEVKARKGSVSSKESIAEKLRVGKISKIKVVQKSQGLIKGQGCRKNPQGSKTGYIKVVRRSRSEKKIRTIRKDVKKWIKRLRKSVTKLLLLCYQAVRFTSVLSSEWDILELLSINGSQTGVSAARGPIPDTPAWRLRAVYDNIQIEPAIVPKVSSFI